MGRCGRQHVIASRRNAARAPLDPIGSSIVPASSVVPLRAVAALFLERQHLDRPRGRGFTAARVTRLAADTGGLQIDSINVIDRAPPPRADGIPFSSSMQAVRMVWRDIQAEEQRMLERISLAGVVQQLERDSAVSYQI